MVTTISSDPHVIVGVDMRVEEHHLTIDLTQLTGETELDIGYVGGAGEYAGLVITTGEVTVELSVEVLVALEALFLAGLTRARVAIARHAQMPAIS